MTADPFAADIRSAYSASADAWADGPASVYSALARAMLAHAPVPVRGASVFDAGAGTGVAAHAALAAGARIVVAGDLSAAMVSHAPDPVRRVVADLTRLPLRDDSFVLVTAAFCLGHLPDPLAGLRETRRVAPALVASAFEPHWTHPAKAAVDAALRSFGYETPGWYEVFKQSSEPVVGVPDALAALARQAGYRDVVASVVEVDTGLSSAADLAAYRLGMAHVAPFMAGVDAATRAAVRAASVEAVRVAGIAPLIVPMVVLAARR